MRLAGIEKMWEHDIESAWDMVDGFLKDRGHNRYGREDIMGLLDELPYDQLTEETITRIVEDYEDR